VKKRATLPFLILALAWTLPFPAPAAQAPSSGAELIASSQAFARLADDYWDLRMRLSPLDATFSGYPKYHDRLDDNSPAGRKEELRELEGLLSRLAGIDSKELSESERLSADVMKWQIEVRLESFPHQFHQWNVDHMDGPQSWIPTVIELAQPMKTEADAEALLSRMRAMPTYFRNQIDNLREGLKERRVAARVPVEKAIAQLEDILKTPADRTPYAAAAGKLPEALKAKYLPLIAAEVEKSAYAAARAYLEFLKRDYLPRSRRGNHIGLSGTPGGLAAYRQRIRYHTTLDKTPEELHKMGTEELDGIHSEMRTIARRMGHAGSLKSFIEKMRKDPVNHFSTREEVIENARQLVARATAKLPEFFGLLPKTALLVKPIEDYKEKNDVAARYFQPPDDLSRPGIYYINAYEPRTRPRYSMTSLAVHEGVPGHHLQIAIALEQRGLPTFRRNADSTAFIEGWALYAERLAEEMGLYEDDLSRIGMLSDQALRASRLVVDTGLHARGWSRKKAISFMKANTPMSEHEIIAEVDRYTIWPGQALAYKVGQREIMALRRRSREKLGVKFDIRAFHDAVLKNGAIPLQILRRMF
jgi:uncharacterized protein (DUF885 family)